MYRSEFVLGDRFGDVEVNFRFRKNSRTENTKKWKSAEGLISFRITQENIILWLQSMDPHKCGLDICSDQN